MGFFDKILKEFGVYYTQLAIVAPVILASYKLDKYFDSASWVLTMALTLCIVFAFKNHISDSVSKTAWQTTALFLPLIGLEIWLLFSEYSHYLLQNKIALTAYNAIIISAIVGAIIISYKKTRKKSRKRLSTKDTKCDIFAVA